MTHSKVSHAVLVALLQLGASATSSAQDSPASGQDFEAIPHAQLSPDGLPEFEIEIVVFAYDAFDPTEEDFSREHVALKADGLPAVGDLPPSGPEEFAVATTHVNRSASQSDEEWAPDESFHFELLAPTDLTLTAACDKLERLDAYTVLVHGGWIQEGLSEEDAHEIDMSFFGEPSVSGTLRFHVGRFAHITAAIEYHAPAKTDLRLRASNPDIDLGSMSSPRKLELRQSRLLRSGELHYLDHPAFGLLVTVRRHGEAER